MAWQSVVSLSIEWHQESGMWLDWPNFGPCPTSHGIWLVIKIQPTGHRSHPWPNNWKWYSSPLLPLLLDSKMQVLKWKQNLSVSCLYCLYWLLLTIVTSGKWTIILWLYLLSTFLLYRASFKSQKHKKCKSTILCTQKVQKVGKVDKLYKVK